MSSGSDPCYKKDGDKIGKANIKRNVHVQKVLIMASLVEAPPASIVKAPLPPNSKSGKK